MNAVDRETDQSQIAPQQLLTCINHEKVDRHWGKLICTQII